MCVAAMPVVAQSATLLLKSDPYFARRSTCWVGLVAQSVCRCVCVCVCLCVCVCTLM